MDVHVHLLTTEMWCKCGTYAVEVLVHAIEQEGQQLRGVVLLVAREARLELANDL